LLGLLYRILSLGSSPACLSALGESLKEKEAKDDAAVKAFGRPVKTPNFSFPLQLTFAAALHGRKEG